MLAKAKPNNNPNKTRPTPGNKYVNSEFIVDLPFFLQQDTLIQLQPEKLIKMVYSNFSFF